MVALHCRVLRGGAVGGLEASPLLAGELLLRLQLLRCAVLSARACSFRFSCSFRSFRSLAAVAALAFFFATAAAVRRCC